MTCSFLIAPGTSTERAREIAKVTSGFIYMLARAGVTGEQRGVASGFGGSYCGFEKCDRFADCGGFWCFYC